MTATAAEALELALWLHRAPARRSALLGRPLPDGIGHLLRVAGGSRDQLAAAARITGESEATILEAVRFYLQQILFHEDADAYRVLGLRHDASKVQAREHHRLLQHWLHPDRRGADEWESIYAGRVNRAWTQLRTVQARAAYDATLPPVTSTSSQYGLEYKAPVAPRANARQTSLSRNLTFIVLLGCVGLLVVIGLRNEQPPQWHDNAAAVAASPGPLVSVASNRVADATLAESAIAVPDQGVVAADTGQHAETMRTPTVKPVSETAATPLDMLMPLAAASPLVPPLPHAASGDRVPTARKLQQTVPVALEPAGRYWARPVAPDVEPPQSPERVVRGASLDQSEREPPPQPEPAPPAKTTKAVQDPMARMAQLRHLERQLSSYLGNLAEATPPVWNDITALRHAQTTRAGLHQRLDMPRRIDVRLKDPQWRMGPHDAHLAAGYQAAREKGRLEIDFTWRENQWLVREILLVPAP